MHCIKKITDDLIWVGANDRRLAMFEGVYSVPCGVSYNSYLLLDDKTVLFDTVDKSVFRRFIENLTFALDGRLLDYLVIQHMEPDHSDTICELVLRYPNVKIVCNTKTVTMLNQFYNLDADAHIVKENDVLCTGKHTLTFIMAPMVHWPEVMVTFDQTDKILFSADAFGTFGALNGALFADEVDFNADYMDEARRYYTNIVGKYGVQTCSLLEKASSLDIKMICPLHGFVWRKNFTDIISKYLLWGNYEPEEYGVLIAYASVYGNTENAAEILSSILRDRGIKTVMFDVSVARSSDIVAEAFKLSHFVFASTTYNAGIFISMEELLNDLAAHNIQNRTVGIIENGSWAASSGKLIREKLEKCKNLNILEQCVSIKSGLKDEQITQLGAMADAIVIDISARVANSGGATSSGGGASASSVGSGSAVNSGSATSSSDVAGSGEVAPVIDPAAMFKFSYGLFVLTAKDGCKDNGCIINTPTQIASLPLRISIAVSKSNFTCDMIAKTGVFNLSVLSISVPFELFKQFGFQSGRETDKFTNCGYADRTSNGVRYIPEHVNAVFSAKVTEAYDYGSHTLFIAEITQSFVLSKEPSVTYQYYFDNIKPKPQPKIEKKKGFICKICGYIYEGDQLPPDFICPICKHGAIDFEPL